MLWLVAAGAVPAGAALAGTAPAVAVKAPFAVASVGGQAVAAGFMTLTASEDDALVGAESPAESPRVEIHRTRFTDGVMRMRTEARVALPSGEAVMFEPGGLHLMFMDLKEPLVPGMEVLVVLHFEKAGSVEVVFPVKARHLRARHHHQGHQGHQEHQH